MLAVFLAVTTLHAYAATPAQAVVTIVSRGLRSPASVRRVNRVGRYAVVLTAGGTMEGSAVTEPILVERFSFGWQPLDVINARCQLESHALGARVDALLMRGMPEPRDDRPCRGFARDRGSDADVEAVRRLMRGPLVPYVVVAGDWALGEWYGAGGGEALYRKRDSTWMKITQGGGALGPDDMRAFGVPKAYWCEFGAYGDGCPSRSY